MPFESSVQLQKKVLVIEDEDVFRLTLVSYLRKQNFLVMDTKNGREGLAAILIFQPDIVISDLHMPGVNGHQVINYIHQRYPLLPVIVISAVDKYEELTQSLREGAVDYLMKPIMNWAVVKQAIDEQLYRDRSELIELISHRDALRWNDDVSKKIISMSHPGERIFYENWVIDNQSSSSHLYMDSIVCSHQLIVFIVELFPELIDAAFISAALKFLFDSPISDEGTECSPKDILSSLNWHLNQSGMMSTVNCAVFIFNQKNEHMIYSNAGLKSPFWLKEHGALSLGILADTEYHNYVKAIEFPFNMKIHSEDGEELDLKIERR